MLNRIIAHTMIFVCYLAYHDNTKEMFLQKQNTADLAIETNPEGDGSENQDQSIVRSPPAGTKETPNYKASIDLEQAKKVFEAADTSSPRSGRSSRCKYLLG